jgi:cation diffusion facilitator CzcD-associated flavoprotein CzcO
LGHIGAEVLLDRALLHQSPDLAKRFYACFTPEILEEAYTLLDLKGLEAWVPRLQTGIEAFLRRRYLEDYAGTYLSRTWPDIYQHITKDASACQFPEALWLQAVEEITDNFLSYSKTLPEIFGSKIENK